MTLGSASWDDLRARVITGAILIALGVVLIWLGGVVFAIFAALVTGVMIWELARMIAADKKAEAMQLAVLTVAAVLLARHLPGVLVVGLLVLPALVGGYLLQKNRALFAPYAIGVVVAGYGLTIFRDLHGGLWLFWLVGIVACTDIAGYFVGKLVGGAKFWPSVSPKKTWAGIIAGWGAAAGVGLAFLAITDAGRDLIWISVLLGFVSQMGDIAESAIKRRVGVKDSSQLLPGHGGVLDRFDALLGASLFMLLIALFVDVPDLRY